MQLPLDPTTAACGGELVPNTEQAEAWNGDQGRHWVMHCERYDQMLRRFTPQLLNAADVAVDDRLIDIGCGSGDDNLPRRPRGTTRTSAGSRPVGPVTR